MEDLREEFPVLRRLAYLNAGTDGPLPAVAVAAARAELERELADGRTQAHFQRRTELAGALRHGYAEILHCDAADVALTTCTSDGMATVVDGLGLREGQEILTSDEEHPGLLGALVAARELHGVSIRVEPLAQIADAVGPDTALVACSHVSWMTGSVAPAALARLDVPVLLDGAQGLGAIPTDVGALGCAAYAAAGQKWLCGPDGIGSLYVSRALRERLRVARRGYGNLSEPNRGLDASLHEDARALDTMALSAETLALADAALGVLRETGWDELHARGIEQAAQLADRLREAGREVAPRGDSTLVAFSSTDPEGERERLAAADVVVRDLPGSGMLRASVGAWNDERDLRRLVDELVRQ